MFRISKPFTVEIWQMRTLKTTTDTVKSDQKFLPAWYFIMFLPKLSLLIIETGHPFVLR